MTGKDPLFDVTGKICIVTGGLGQIGGQFVKALHERDAKVAIWGRHMEQERAEKKFAELGVTLDENIRLYQVDITKKEDLNNALDDMEAVWGTPEIGRAHV